MFQIEENVVYCGSYRGIDVPSANLLWCLFSLYQLMHLAFYIDIKKFRSYRDNIQFLVRPGMRIKMRIPYLPRRSQTA
jgi:hypothetical protein